MDFVRSLRQDVTPTSAVIKAPSFDHAVKDPVPEAIHIMPHHRIIVVEGLYTFLSIEPWYQAGILFDERWFIDVDIVEARRRIIDRHVITGIAKDREGAVTRADENDMPNGIFVIHNSLTRTMTILSVYNPDLEQSSKDLRRLGG